MLKKLRCIFLGALYIAAALAAALTAVFTLKNIVNKRLAAVVDEEDIDFDFTDDAADTEAEKAEEEATASEEKKEEE